MFYLESWRPLNLLNSYKRKGEEVVISRVFSDLLGVFTVLIVQDVYLVFTQ